MLTDVDGAVETVAAATELMTPTGSESLETGGESDGNILAGATGVVLAVRTNQTNIKKAIIH